MKKILFLCLMALPLLMSCSKDEYDSFGTLYGVVTDTNTGAPLGNVTVTLSPGGASKLTGSNGLFEFEELTPQQYTIRESGGVLTMSSTDELTVAAQVVDEWHEVLSNGAHQVFLLVQTKKNPMYTYESVSVTKKYPFSARVFVPGMAQLHKGSTGKGIAFITAEVAAIGGVVAFEGLRSSYKSKINTTKNAKSRQNYIDKADRMQNLRNGFIAGAVAIYAWNIVDGIVAKGKKHVEVGHVAMRFAPVATPEAGGLAMNISF